MSSSSGGMRELLVDGWEKPWSRSRMFSPGGAPSSSGSPRVSSATRRSALHGQMKASWKGAAMERRPPARPRRCGDQRDRGRDRRPQRLGDGDRGGPTTWALHAAPGWQWAAADNTPSRALRSRTRKPRRGTDKAGGDSERDGRVFPPGPRCAARRGDPRHAPHGLHHFRTATPRRRRNAAARPAKRCWRCEPTTRCPRARPLLIAVSLALGDERAERLLVAADARVVAGGVGDGAWRPEAPTRPTPIVGLGRWSSQSRVEAVTDLHCGRGACWRSRWSRAGERRAVDTRPSGAAGRRGHRGAPHDCPRRRGRHRKARATRPLLRDPR